MTTAILVLAGVGLDRLALSYVHVGPAWLSWLLSTFVALGLVVGLIFLAPPDRLAGGGLLPRRDRRDRRALDRSRATARTSAAAWASLAFGVALRAPVDRRQRRRARADDLHRRSASSSFFVLNGYLLGREYFELGGDAAHVPAAEARDLFDRRWLEVFAAGAIVSALVAVPVVNLLTPLYATAFLTRVYKRIS